ncbi:U3 small nucleolar RNA-associated protein 6 [Nematocida ausubeli]|uniref:U3 small nucleolar RNA-associated protein 6 N-terminal domain-containing protein n=1 Tax=Nematocida ausubeli (strain ATCC PRA-371 / ERTm2) TaxID=1913371 RepID=H8ZBF8_NEMA1|nr:hypothetical protein NERG_00907 [Nematocida ausubeli]KAI5149648.1 U3 small nucleolar RNA-associated protein 6 [Nematocida ausubeli]
MSSSVISEMEHMVPELSYYKDKNIFSPAEIEAIIKKRKNFEQILSVRPRLSIFLLYIEYEVLLERIYLKRAKDVKNKRNYITKRIDSLYCRAQFSCLGVEELFISHLEYFLSVNNKEKIKEISLSIPKKCTGSLEVWLRCAFALRAIGEVEGSRILLQRSLRVLSHEKNRIIEEYIKLEEENEESDSPRIIEVLRKEIGVECK